MPDNVMKAVVKKYKESLWGGKNFFPLPKTDQQRQMEDMRIMTHPDYKFYESLIGSDPNAWVRNRALVPQDRDQMMQYMIKSLIEGYSTDKFFYPKGREDFIRQYGFDYPGITPYEQETRPGREWK